ncbi:MAG: hypothetical protein V1672_01345 [Candidatus Diapherotrites archaeon]
MVDIIDTELGAIDELVTALTAEHGRVKSINAIRAGNCEKYIKQLVEVRKSVAEGTSLKENPSLWSSFEGVRAKTITLVGITKIPKAVGLDTHYEPQKATRVKPKETKKRPGCNPLTRHVK